METVIVKNKIYELSLERTLPYFLKHIGSGKYLSEAICKGTNFREGRFFTILPTDIKPEKLYHFEHGGMVTSMNISNQNTKIIFTMDESCSDFIFHYLSQNQNNAAIVENYMMEPESPFAAIENVQLRLFHSEVYYFLQNGNTKEEIYRTIRKSSLVWHFLTVLTHTQIPNEFTKPVIEEICENAQFLIGGAYDGEGYIFWEKSNPTAY